MKLSEHFTLSELTRSATAAARGIKNEPSGAELDNLRWLAGELEKARAVIGAPVVVSSAFRCEALNRAVGGSATSAHRHGLAADIRAPKCGDARAVAGVLAAAMKSGRIECDQIILEFPERGAGAWVHVGYRRGREQRREVLTATKRGGRTVYERGLPE